MNTTNRYSLLLNKVLNASGHTKRLLAICQLYYSGMTWASYGVSYQLLVYWLFNILFTCGGNLSDVVSYFPYSPLFSLQYFPQDTRNRQPLFIYYSWMALQWRHKGYDTWRLKSPASPFFTQQLIQVQIKENTKAPRHWPLCGEFAGDRWIPRTNGQ